MAMPSILHPSCWGIAIEARFIHAGSGFLFVAANGTDGRPSEHCLDGSLAAMDDHALARGNMVINAAIAFDR